MCELHDLSSLTHPDHFLLFFFLPLHLSLMSCGCFFRYNKDAGAFLQTNCTNCPQGSYSDKEGKTNLADCVLCPSGKFSAKTGNVEVANCELCDAGRYSTTEGADTVKKCIACLPGRYVSLSFMVFLFFLKHCHFFLTFVLFPPQHILEHHNTLYTTVAASTTTGTRLV